MQILMNAVSTMEDVSRSVLTWKAHLNVNVTVVTNSPAMEDTVLVSKGINMCLALVVTVIYGPVAFSCKPVNCCKHAVSL